MAICVIAVFAAKNANGQQNVDSVYYAELNKNSLLEISVDETFQTTTEITPFASNVNLSNFLLSGHVLLENPKSFVRVVLVDNNYNEYLVYESNYLLADSSYVEIDKEFFETGYLQQITPLKVLIILEEATLYIDKFSFGQQSYLKSSIIETMSSELISNKHSQVVDKINSLAEEEKILWVAGETSVSQMSYQEKKALFGGDTLPNLYGLDYYIGGIFEFPDNDTSVTPTNKSTSAIVDNFNWRNRHGRNWVTSVKNQVCGSCWAYSAVGVVEGLVNIYYNQLLNLDLSEHNIISCTPTVYNSQGEIANHNDCSGGHPYYALQYIKNNGIVNQSCCTTINNNCNNVCNNPSELIKVTNNNIIYNPSMTQIKTSIITKGMLAAAIDNWKHSMLLVGYGTIKKGDMIANDVETPSQLQNILHKPIQDNNPNIGKTFFIFKNSWGTSWGGSGYLYIIANPSRIKTLNYITTPIMRQGHTDADIVCEDRDGDGYYYWGIGPKPATCPNCPDEPDCDDSNPMYGPYTPTYDCSILCENYVYSDTTIEIKENQTWNYPLQFNKNILIKNGVTLTIANTMQFGEDVMITVEQGGKLIIDGGTLTNLCPDKYWRGIYVLGNPYLPQTETSKGVIELHNGAIIENALCAVTLLSYWFAGGGIIKAENSTFRNNIRSVAFMEYHNIILNGTLQNNVSYFTNCTFEWDNDMMPNEATIHNHVSMWAVEGVKFNGCQFINNYTLTEKNTIGIGAIKSGFSVYGTRSLQSGETNSTFDNFIDAIRVEDLTGQKVNVRNTDFNSNFCGVFASNANNFSVTFCNFNIPGIEGSYIYKPEYLKAVGFGIFSDVSTGYGIFGNTFNGLMSLENDPRTMGIQVVNSGDANNVINNNTFNNLYCGSQALGKNRGKDVGNITQGLQYLCNDFNENSFGLYISKYQTNDPDIYGIRTEQGSLSFPAFNTFDNNYWTNICNVNCPPIYYSYPVNVSNTLPSSCSSNLTLVGLSNYTNKCLFERSILKGELLSELDILNNDYLLLLYNYNNLLDGGQTSILLDKLEGSWSIDQWQLRNELLENSPYLSIDVLIELVKSEKLPLVMCAEVLLSNPDATKRETFTRFMNDEPNYLTLLAKQLIEDSWNTRTFRTTMESNMSAKASEIEFTQRGIIDCILTDTLGVNIEEYRNVLSNINNAHATFELVDSYIGTKDYAMATEILQNMQNTEFVDSLEINDYLAYISIISDTNTTNIDETLLPLSENYTRAGRKAKSLLQFKEIVNDYHPYIVPDEEPEQKSARIKGSLADLMNDNIQVQPNPAKDYVSIIYNIAPQTSQYTFKITDNMGKVLIVEKLKSNKGMQTIDIRALNNGSYVYSVEGEKGIIKSDKLVIIKK
ncbi:MAG: T9SS type A sorting domain-containing protein [Bacteroidales bacterium]|nr:T9SS type A sorting domain-containing protein [Bacteroidales bacterium]